MKLALTVGVLFPGEMGSVLGGLLRARGIHVVTTLQGRSMRTAELCHAAELTELSSLREVVSCADVIISTVPPADAVRIAQQVRAEFPVARQPVIYVDANSVSPVTMMHLGEVLRLPDFILVDASIHGLASRITQHGTMYLSGSEAAEVAAIVGSPPRTVVVGQDVGQASLLKMLLGGTSKGLVALLLELSDLAHREGMLEEFWAEFGRFYPGVMEPFQRLLPTYSEHIGRRIQEIGELELTLATAGRDPIMATAVRTLLSRCARSPATLRTLVERLSAAAARGRG